MRISLHGVRSDFGQFQVIERCLPQLTGAGYTVRQRHDQTPVKTKADIWIVHQSYATPDILNALPANSVILMERIDSAQLWTRHAAAHPAVRCCAKQACLPAHRTNRCFKRDHETLLVGGDAAGQLPRLDDAALAKVVAGPNFGQYTRIGRFVGVDANLDGARPVDVFFAGNTRIYEPAINAHRQRAIAAIDALHDECVVRTLASKSLPRSAYDRATRESKIVVSPWGNGELCHRDFDAMWCGAVLVKPKSDHVHALPGMFRSGQTYVPCRADFTDLREVVRSILDNWSGYRDMRRHNHEMVHNWYQPAAVVGWLDGIAKEN